MSDSTSNPPQNTAANWAFVIPDFETLSPDMQNWIMSNMQTLLDEAFSMQDMAQPSTEGGAEPIENATSSEAEPPSNLGLLSSGLLFQISGSDSWMGIDGNQRNAIGEGQLEVIDGINIQNTGQALGSEGNDDNALTQYTDVTGNEVSQVSWNFYQYIGYTHYSAIGEGPDSDSTMPLAVLQNIQGDQQAQVMGSSLHQIQGNESRHIGTLPPKETTSEVVVSDHVVNGSHSQIVNGNRIVYTGGSEYRVIGAAANQLVASSLSTTAPKGTAAYTLPTSALYPPNSTATPSLTPTGTVSGLLQESGNDVSWTEFSSGGLPDPLYSTAVGTSPELPEAISTEIIGGNAELTIQGDYTQSISGLLTMETSGAEETHSNFVMSTFTGMRSETTMGLVMDTMLALNMPFECLSMPFALMELKQQLIGMDGSLCEIETKALKIITEGGAAAESEEAASAAAQKSAEETAAETAAKDAAADLTKATGEQATKDGEAAAAKEAATKAADKQVTKDGEAAAAKDAAENAAKEQDTKEAEAQAAKDAAEKAAKEQVTKDGEAAAAKDAAEKAAKEQATKEAEAQTAKGTAEEATKEAEAQAAKQAAEKAAQEQASKEAEAQAAKEAAEKAAQEQATKDAAAKAAKEAAEKAAQEQASKEAEAQAAKQAAEKAAQEQATKDAAAKAAKEAADEAKSLETARKNSFDAAKKASEEAAKEAAEKASAKAAVEAGGKDTGNIVTRNLPNLGRGTNVAGQAGTQTGLRTDQKVNPDDWEDEGG